MVKSDTLIETHHFRRVIRLKKGALTLETKKYDSPSGNIRHKFNVDTLSIHWRAGESVDYLMAYGTAVGNKKLNCRRRYDPSKIPAEVMAFVGDELKKIQ